MRVLVCGGRDYNDREQLFTTLNEFEITEIIHGGARGADTLAGEWAKENGIPCEVYPALWDEHGRAAGVIRNQLMLEDSKPDLVLAFPGGKGTAHMVRIARDAGVPVDEVYD